MSSDFFFLDESYIYLPGIQALYDLILTYFPSLFLTAQVHCLHNLAKGTVALPPLGLAPGLSSISAWPMPPPL